MSREPLGPVGERTLNLRIKFPDGVEFEVCGESQAAAAAFQRFLDDRRGRFLKVAEPEAAASPPTASPDLSERTFPALPVAPRPVPVPPPHAPLEKKGRPVPTRTCPNCGTGTPENQACVSCGSTLGLSRPVVANNGNRQSKWNTELGRKMWDNGVTIGGIGLALGVAPGCVRAYSKDHWPRRKRGWHMTARKQGNGTEA